MSFQRRTTIGSIPLANSAATASRTRRAPSFSRRRISTHPGAGGPPPRDAPRARGARAAAATRPSRGAPGGARRAAVGGGGGDAARLVVGPGGVHGGAPAAGPEQGREDIGDARRHDEQTLHAGELEVRMSDGLVLTEGRPLALSVREL